MPRVATSDYDPMLDELPPELAAQYRAEQRKQRIAGILSGQAMTPLQAPEVKGRFQGAISPLAGIAQLAQAYLSGKMQNDSDARMADVRKQGQDAYSAEVQRVGEVMSGRPGKPEQALFTDDWTAVPKEDQVTAAVPATPPGTTAQVAQALLGSYAPSLRRMGETTFKSDLESKIMEQMMGRWGQNNAPAQAPAAPAGDPLPAEQSAARAAPPSPGSTGIPGWDMPAGTPTPDLPGWDPSSATFGGPRVAPNVAGQQRILAAEAQDPAIAAETRSLALRHPDGRGPSADLAVRAPAAAAPQAPPPAAAPLTPLERYTSRQKYSKQDAAEMMVSGKPMIAKLGKAIFDGYEQAERETLVKQPGREALAAIPVTPITVQDPNDPTRTVVMDGRTKEILGTAPATSKATAATEKADAAKQKEVEKMAAVDTQLDGIERNLNKLITPEGKITKGLKSAVGQLDQYWPEWAMTSDTASANSALKSLQDQMTMLNLAAAKTAVGQSFGSMQVKEWDKFMNGLTNISRGVPDAEMEGNLKFVQGFIKDKRDVLRTAIYAGTHGAGAAPAAAGAPGPAAPPAAATGDDAGYEAWKKSKGLK